MASRTADSSGPEPEDYGPEILCANWNPSVPAVAAERRRDAATGAPDIDVGDFLFRMYRCQQA